VQTQENPMPPERASSRRKSMAVPTTEEVHVPSRLLTLGASEIMLDEDLSKKRRVSRAVVLPQWPARNDDEHARGHAQLRSLDLDATTFSSDGLCHLCLEIFDQVHHTGLPRFWTCGDRS
jgi:hypothetical protein